MEKTTVLSLQGNSKIDKIFLRFDLITQKWTELSPMNTSRAFFSAVASSNLSSIYVMGGVTEGGKAVNHVERFDMLTNQWEYLAPMCNAR